MSPSYDLLKEFMQTNNLTIEQHTRQTLKYAQTYNPEFYSTLGLQPAEFRSLDSCANKILSALDALKMAPIGFNRSAQSQAQVDWDDLDSIAQYAQICYRYYKQMKNPKRTFRDFRSCLDAMGYVDAIDLIIGNNWQGNQLFAAAKSYSSIVESRGRVAHSRLMRTGRRSFELLDIFGGFGAFAILEVFSLEIIIDMTSDRFRDFTIFLQHEVDKKSDIVESIMEADIDPRLFNIFGPPFSPRVEKYLPPVNSDNNNDDDDTTYSDTSDNSVASDNSDASNQNDSSEDDEDNYEENRRITRRRRVNY